MHVLSAIAQGGVPATLVDLLPPGARSTGLSLAHNVAMAIFGGTAPLLAAAAVQGSGLAAVGGILTAAAAVSAAAVLALRRQGIA